MVGDNDGDDDDDEDEQEVVVWLLRGRMAEQRATIFTSSPGAGLAWLLTCYHLHHLHHHQHHVHPQSYKMTINDDTAVLARINFHNINHMSAS